MSFEKFIITILYIHQTFDIIGIKGYVDRPELISPDTIGWIAFTVLLVLYYLGIPYINYIFLVLFALVLFGFYMFHWKLFFFGATEKKIKGYNNYFKGTQRIMKESPSRLVPDKYHIIHTILYLIAFLALLVNVVLAI